MYQLSSVNCEVGQNMRGPPKSICGPRKYPAIHCHPQMPGTPSPTFSHQQLHPGCFGSMDVERTNWNLFQVLTADLQAQQYQTNCVLGLFKYKNQKNTPSNIPCFKTKTKNFLQNLFGEEQRYTDTVLPLFANQPECNVWGQIRLSECPATCLKMATYS